jgi:hypothetical protein
MTKQILPFLLLLVPGGLFSQSVKVVFTVNTSIFPDTVLPHHVVQLRGGLNEGVTNPPIAWDEKTIAFTNTGGAY